MDSIFIVSNWKEKIIVICIKKVKNIVDELCIDVYKNLLLNLSHAQSPALFLKNHKTDRPLKIFAQKSHKFKMCVF